MYEGPGQACPAGEQPQIRVNWMMGSTTVLRERFEGELSYQETRKLNVSPLDKVSYASPRVGLEPTT